MTVLILDPVAEETFLDQRRELGLDSRDEVWEGVYIVSPLANDEHQEITGNLTIIFGIVVQFAGLGKVRPGVNVSDRIVDWKQNYRCPDVVVFLNGTKAQNHDTFWFGGPDFAVEVVSRYDRSREKLDFYAKVGTRELLIVDRAPWALELYRLDAEGAMVLVGRSTLDQPEPLISVVLPLSFHLESGAGRPMICVAHADGIQSWSA